MQENATDWKRVFVNVAVDAAKNCIAVFERTYPADSRPRKALEAAEQWLANPTDDNRVLAERVETPVWRSKDWPDPRARSAALACAYAARAVRAPMTSPTWAIDCECFANGQEFGNTYSKKWLDFFLRKTRAQLY